MSVSQRRICAPAKRVYIADESSGLARTTSVEGIRSRLGSQAQRFATADAESPPRQFETFTRHSLRSEMD